MKFTPLAIPDIILIEPRVFEDPRGFFLESYNYAVFSKHGIKDIFVQDNHSKSARGVLRGLHYQVPPKAQAKLGRVIRGKAFDVAVDIRRHSKSFGRHVSLVLNAEDKSMLYIPSGFAHGYCALEDETEFIYKVSDFYSPEHERGILWNDPALKIDWPKMEYTLSPRDQKHLAFKDAVYF